MRCYAPVRAMRTFRKSCAFSLNRPSPTKYAMVRLPKRRERAASREVGSAETVRQKVWSAGWESLALSVAQDIRYGVRQTLRSPGFSIVAILTLALGIGANTAIFTLVQGILLRSLPVSRSFAPLSHWRRHPLLLLRHFESDDGDFDLFAYDLYRRFQQAAPEFEQLAAIQAGGGGFSVRWGSAPARAMRAEYVSGNYFTTFGVGTYAGRTRRPPTTPRGAAPVVVLSYRAWQTSSEASPESSVPLLYLEQRAFTVAGIAPPGFYGDRIAPFPPDIWLPLAIEPQMEGANSSLLQPDTAWLYAVGRLRPNVDLASLQTRLSGVLRQWMQTVPAFTDHGGAALISKQHVVLSPAGGGIQKIQRQTGTGLRILMLLAGVVLLIACVNIANLLLARSMAQRREIAVRIGLGASRGRIIRQIVTESLILSIAGGAAGLTIAFFGSRAIASVGVSALKGHAGIRPILPGRCWPSHFWFRFLQDCSSLRRRHGFHPTHSLQRPHAQPTTQRAIMLQSRNAFCSSSSSRSRSCSLPARFSQPDRPTLKISERVSTRRIGIPRSSI